jgi:4-amino-4-deoxy-L-arabinose transferase-like glycosyltransferase
MKRTVHHDATEEPSRPDWTPRIVLAVEIAALVVFVGAAIGFAVITLPYGTPDEPGHTTYAEAISHGHFPTPDFGTGQSGPWLSPQAHHPPLYYAIVGGAWALTGRQPGLIGPIGRAVNVLAALVALLLLRAAMHRGFPDLPLGVAAGLAFAASFSSFTYVMGSFNNDPLAVLLVCVAMYLAVRSMDEQRPLPWIAAVGASLGVGLLAKLTAVVIVVPLAVAAIHAARREGRGALRASTLLLMGLAVGAIISAPWFIRNQVLLGTPTFNCATRPVFHSLAEVAAGWDGALALALIAMEEMVTSPWWPDWLLMDSSSLIAALAFPQEEHMGREIWRLVLPIAGFLAALIGLGRRPVAEDEAGESRRSATVTMLALIPVVAMLGIIHQLWLVDYLIVRWVGRYLGTMAPAVAMGLGLGLTLLLPKKARPALPMVVVLLAAALNVGAIVRVERFYRLAPSMRFPGQASAIGGDEVPVHPADADEVAHHLHPVGTRVDLRVGGVDPAHRHLDHAEAEAQGDEDQLRVEGPALQALVREDALDGLPREHLEAALRVADA